MTKIYLNTKMINLLKKGHKIKLKYWDEHQYIYLDKDIIKNDANNPVHEKVVEFFKHSPLKWIIAKDYKIFSFNEDITIDYEAINLLNAGHKLVINGMAEGGFLQVINNKLTYAGIYPLSFHRMIETLSYITDKTEWEIVK